MTVERLPRGSRARPARAVAAPSSTASTASTATTVPATTTTADAFHGARDMRVRVGATALSGPTTTAVPKLVDDWRGALLQAAAEGRADDEIIAPALGPALQRAEQHKGEALSRREARGVEHDVRQQLKQPWDDAYGVHLADVTKSPAVKRQVERDVLLAERPRIAALKDPFTPVIHNAPGARDNEIVLWENHNAIVLVDTFAPSPKALVVPKTPASVPTDLSPTTLDELARVAAHVSDAFLRATGCPAAGIWVNPPQHLTVKQLHVHVLPDVGAYTADGAPAKALLDDAQLRPQLLAWFSVVERELATKLGAPNP
jgi:diadenosine tetraphosphate (Ap4A) HIT family hydrolase